MKKYTITIIDQDIINKCKKYAEGHLNDGTSSDRYKGYNKGISDDDIYRGNLLGKLSEYAVSFVLQTNPPDCNIYPDHLKSHSADLIYKNHKIHVKSCEIRNYTHSWMYMKNAHYKFKDIHCFCLIDPSLFPYTNYTIQMFFVKGKDLKGLYKSTYKYQPKKCAIYLNDLKEAGLYE